MSMEQLAYLAEVLGVFGVIASLLYVGRQVQQSTQQMRVEASGNRLQIFLQFWFSIARDRDFATLWHAGDSDFSSLDDIDRLRLLSFETAGLMVWSYFFELRQADLLSEVQWKEQLTDIENVGRRQVMQEAWKGNKDRFSGPFQQFLASYIE